MTQYKGIVTATLKHKNKIVARNVCHNGAKVALQIAFAKMLANYSTTEYLPYYMSGSYVVIVDDEPETKTLGKVKLTGRNYQYKNGRYATVCNAFFPVDTTDNVLNGLSLTLLTQDGETELASVEFPPEDIDSYDIQSGLQLNIRWEMYLAIDEVINNG